jgi:hypothetical protein
MSVGYEDFMLRGRIEGQNSPRKLDDPRIITTFQMQGTTKSFTGKKRDELVRST